MVVDPEIHDAAWGDDTYVMSGFTRDNSFDAELKVGTYDSGGHIGRSYMHFTTSALAGASVQKAELHLAERWSWNCSYSPEPVYRVTQGWDGRTMTSFPGAAVDPTGVAGAWGSGACHARTAVWNVTAFASYWASVGETQGSLSLRAGEEADNNRWKKYASTEAGAPPALHVWYTPPNQAPGVPTGVSPVDGAVLGTASPSVSAVYSDPDGGSGQLAFGVWDAQGQLVWAQWSGPVCSGCGSTLAVPALVDGWYYVMAIGHDGVQYSPAWSSPQWFFIDTAAPSASELTPASGSSGVAPTQVSARYSEPYGFSGYVYFWLYTSGGTKVIEAWSGLTVSGSVATLAIPALSPGSYDLWAMAWDTRHVGTQIGPNTIDVVEVTTATPTSTTVPAPPPPPTASPVGAVDPGPDGSVSIPSSSLTPEPPVAPMAMELPLRSGLELIADLEASALEAMGATQPSFVTEDSPDLDPDRLQPQVGSAQLLATNPATLEETVHALADLQVPPPLPLNPAALLEALPGGLPTLTYRLCSESAGMEVSCSISVPLAAPQLIDVTGDGTVDILADVLPVLSPTAVIAAVDELLDVEDLLAEAEDQLAAVLALLEDLAEGETDPELEQQALDLEALVGVLLAEVDDKLDALLSAVNVGLGLAVVRLPTSETTGGPLPAHLWAVYDLPGANRVSLGYDGYRRGDSLPGSVFGSFTFGPGAPFLLGPDGYDLRAAVAQEGAAGALALTMGLATVGPPPEGAALDPTVASVGFSPVPTNFEAHVVSASDADSVTVETTSDASSELDALVVTDHADGYGRLTHLVVDELPTGLSTEVVRTPEDGRTHLDYSASAPVARTELTDVELSGTSFERILMADIADLPTSVDVSVASVAEPGVSDVVLDYNASSPMTSMGLGLYDRGADDLAVTATVTAIPATLDLAVDLPGDHLSFGGDAALGSAEVQLSRGLGSLAPPRRRPRQPRRRRQRAGPE